LLQKREAPPGEKPEPVRTHLRNMIIVPEMIGSIIGVYNGKTFNQVEIKPEMIGHYLAEFSISYKPVKHGRPGIGATHSSRFIPLKWRLSSMPPIIYQCKLLLVLPNYLNALFLFDIVMTLGYQWTKVLGLNCLLMSFLEFLFPLDFILFIDCVRSHESLEKL